MAYQKNLKMWLMEKPTELSSYCPFAEGMEGIPFPVATVFNTLWCFYLIYVTSLHYFPMG
jgi:hypothetical protein